jgi:hypothetical protein
LIPPRNPRVPANADRSGAEPEPSPSLEPRLARLAALIEEFRIEAERYFNGALPIPPEDRRVNVQHALRDLRSMTMRSAADQFRMSGLEARFNLLSESYGRRLREREEGRGSARRREPGEPASRYDVDQGVVLGRTADPEAVEALYAGLARSGAATRLDLETFRGYLARQIEEIRAKTGAEQVQFRLAQEDGRIKLKAKPVGAGGAGHQP